MVNPDAPRHRAAAPADSRASGRGAVVAAVALIVAVGVAAYLTSLSGAFVFDDHVHIVDDARIRHLWPVGALVAHDERPVVTSSLALDYALGGLDPRGYHVVNLAVRLLAALALFAILLRTFRGARLRERWGRSALGLATASALLWVAHPLQTEAVTYVIQRGESLAGLFCLLTLYALIRGAASPRRAGGWYAAAVVACALGMGTKPVMVTAPIAALVYDRVFLAESWRALLAGRGGLYAALAATWGILGYAVASAPNSTAGFGAPLMSPLAYAATQPAVILHYLRLAFWPHPLILDYGWPLASRVGAILPPAIVIAALVGLTLWALARRAPVGYLGAWFFLALAPSSSLVPIKDLAFEHRMYLALAAVVVLVVTGTRALLERIGPRSAPARRAAGAALVILAVVPLAFATAARNRVYHSEISLWEDVIARRPGNAHAYEGLGSAYLAADEHERAIPYLREALRRQPANLVVLENLGVVYLRLGRCAEALVQFDSVLARAPAFGRAHYNRGVALARLGRYAEAIASYEEAIRLLPDDQAIRSDLKTSEVMLGRLDASATTYLEALRSLPAERGTTYEELAPKAAPAYLTIDRTFERRVNGRPAGTVRVVVDFTGTEARVHFETQGALPREVLAGLAAAVKATMARAGAEELDRAAAPPRPGARPE